MPNKNYNLKPQKSLKGKEERNKKGGKKKKQGKQNKSALIWLDGKKQINAKGNLMFLQFRPHLLGKAKMNSSERLSQEHPAHVVLSWCSHVYFQEKKPLYKTANTTKMDGLIQSCSPGIVGSKRKSDPFCPHSSVEKNTLHYIFVF